MDEPMARNDDLVDKPFDPEMTEQDEANAPDDTGRTADASELADEARDRPASDQEEIGV